MCQGCEKKMRCRECYPGSGELLPVIVPFSNDPLQDHMYVTCWVVIDLPGLQLQPNPAHQGHVMRRLEQQRDIPVTAAVCQRRLSGR